ncbi:hypothetical protein ACWENS_10415 [Streptomyces sp. NPDC004532]
MSDRLTPEREAEIVARATHEHLTPGPWEVDREGCDCGGDYPCGHGMYVTGVVTPVPTWSAAERLQRTGEQPRDYDFHRGEIGDFTEADWQLMAHAREDVPALLAEIQRLKARVAALEDALTATGRSLSSFIFDSMDPGTDAMGAQWLYHQAMPNADDPFAQPRAFRSSVLSEAAKAVEEMDGETPEGHSERPQAYRDGYSDGLLDASERLEKLADQAAEGTEVTR